MSSGSGQAPVGQLQEGKGDRVDRTASSSCGKSIPMRSAAPEEGKGREDQGCLFAKESDDCHCGPCSGRYQVRCFGLALVVRPDVIYKDLCERVQAAVDAACVSYDAERGVNLEVTAVRFQSDEAYAACRAFATMSADCVQTRLEEALCREMRFLQSETMPEVVVDTTGYGVPGQGSTFTVLYLWQRAWEKALDLPEVDLLYGMEAWHDPRNGGQRDPETGGEDSRVDL